MTPLSPPSPNLTSEGCWREEQVEDGACEEGTTSGPLLPGCSESSELGHPQGHPVRDSRAVQSRGKRPRWGRSTPPTHTHTHALWKVGPTEFPSGENSPETNQETSVLSLPLSKWMPSRVYTQFYYEVTQTWPPCSLWASNTLLF